LWLKEIEENVCIGAHSRCWRNVELNGRAATPNVNCLLPSFGILELDFVSSRHPGAIDKSRGILLDGTFAYMLHHLTSSQSTMASLGPEHFLEMTKRKQHDVANEDGESECVSPKVIITQLEARDLHGF
jgi:hypothetical protein